MAQGQQWQKSEQIKHTHLIPMQDTYHAAEEIKNLKDRCQAILAGNPVIALVSWSNAESLSCSSFCIQLQN